MLEPMPARGVFGYCRFKDQPKKAGTQALFKKLVPLVGIHLLYDFLNIPHPACRGKPGYGGFCICRDVPIHYRYFRHLGYWDKTQGMVRDMPDGYATGSYPQNSVAAKKGEYLIAGGR